jgi:general secretion pathway protein D
MLRIVCLSLCLALSAYAVAADKAPDEQARQRSQSEVDYLEAVRFVSAGDVQKGRELLDEAIRLNPENFPALTARELIRQQDIRSHVAAGERNAEAGLLAEATGDYRKALALDPENSQAAQGLKAIADRQTGSASAHANLRYRDAHETRLAPSMAPHSFHYRGDSRALLQQLFQAYNIKPLIDSSVRSERIRFDIDDADFATATTIAMQMTKSFYVPISGNQALIASDTLENRKQFERLGLRIFYIGDATTPQELNEVVTLLRSIFEFKSVHAAPGANQIAVRGPADLIEAATHVLEDLFAGKAQVMLDVDVYQLDQTMARTIGIALPTQFTLFNVNTQIQQLLKSGSSSSLINQLISSGAINQAGTSSIAALIGALAAGGGASILSQPIATFGGGITRSGVIIPGTSGQLSLNTSMLRAVDHVMLRAQQNDPATFRDGTRFPILNASYSPIANSSAINRVLGNQSYVAPFPSFTYEDIGLTLKATPTIHGQQDVSLKLDFQLRGLGAAQLNGIPVITNREYSGTISMPFGETALLMGMVTKSEQLSVQGLPGLAQLPFLGTALSTHNKQTEDATLLITIRPHLVRDASHGAASEVFLPSAK